MPQVEDATEQQLWLFQPESEVDVNYLREQSERLAEAVQSQNTVRNYASSWHLFQAWCQETRRPALPASAETVELFLTNELDRKMTVVTAQLRLCAIKDAHRRAGLPMADMQKVRNILAGARHLRKEVPAMKAAILPRELRRISNALRRRGTKRDLRDRAIIVLGFASGLRRSNLSALMLGDVDIVRKGVILRVRSSKTDQDGKGVTLGLHRGRHPETCPARTLGAWLRVRGPNPGPLFKSVQPEDRIINRRIGPEGIAAVVKRGVSLIGLRPERFAGHSLRAGMVTAGFAGGAPIHVIMRRSGHKRIQTMDRYVRTVDPFAGVDPLAKVL